jgi:hypothetical protein
MKNLRIKNVVVASAFVAGNLFTAVANATTYYSSTTPQSFPTNNNNYLYTSSTVPANTALTLSFTSDTAVTANFSLFEFRMNSGVVFNRFGTAPNTGAVVVGSNTWTISAATQTFNNFKFNPGGGLNVTLSNIILCDFATCSTLSSVSAVDLVPNAYALRSVYNIQSAALNAGLSYDCNVFDKQGICLSTGGRYSTTNSPQATTTSGLLIGSYKYDKNIRLGAWVDQNLSTQNADGIKLSNNTPLFGVFGVWAERNDGLGYEVKVSAGYGDKDVTVTRTSTNEGSSKINSRGLQTVSSYGIALNSDWIAAPYVGVKYVSLKRGAYAEAGSGGLAYDNLRQESTSVIAGVKFTGKIDPKTFTVLSAGVEQDLNNNIGQYSAGSSNTTAFNSNVQKTRPVVTAGVFYNIDKTQRVGLNAIHRQEAFQSTASTTALATYTIGF